MNSDSLFLIGMRGCGKTTVGKALAERLGWHFVDTDVLIEQRYNCTIADMVAKDGWELFRQRESEVLQNCAQAKSIISTGGGIILAEINRDFMQNNGQVCFLSVPLETLAQRLSVDAGNRPALTTQGLLKELESILNERLPLYTDTAHFKVDGTLPINNVIDSIYSTLAHFI